MVHPLDVFVGRRLRERRSLTGMTTLQLADSLGVTRQQIEKYESGVDRISSSRIWEIAQAVDVPVLYFFEGLDGQPDQSGRVSRDIFSSTDVLDLVQGFEGARYRAGPRTDKARSGCPDQLRA